MVNVISIIYSSKVLSISFLVFRPTFVYTFQALSEEDRDLWLDAMDGKEPMFVHPPRPSDANQTYLDEAGFNFIAKCFQVLENRGTG